MKILLLVLLLSCQKKAITSSVKSSFVGSNKCLSCHVNEFKEWKKSHHFFSMNEATSQYVKGNFNTTFSYNKIDYRFFKKNNKYLVTADDSQGNMRDFEIKYTFGTEPLQQYLIPTTNGKLQAFNIAWDTKNKKWFHLYPKDKVDFKSPFHWTKISHNWNNRCAECHSTNLEKNYLDDTYKTSFSEINVSCESCHGPASRHLDWVKDKDITNKGLIVDLNDRGVWERQTGSKTLKRKDELKHGSQVENCASCHSLRQKIKTETVGENYLDAFHPRFIEPGRYFPDGQIKEEVYVYGSFLQSKMYHQGVVCTDCHKPHNLKLRAEGNALCLRCHTIENYASKSHHGHNLKSKGSKCVNCHMPERTYMVVDPRRDHKFVIPRPDLTTNNACIDCHKDQKWVSKSFKKLWPTLKTADDSDLTFMKAMQGTPGIGADLLRLIKNPEIPDIIRGSAVKLTSSYPLIQNQAVDYALKNSTTLLVLAGLEISQNAPDSDALKTALTKLLNHPKKIIRSQAALSLNQRGLKEGSAFNKAMGEYIDSINVNIDDPSSLINLGNLNVGDKDYARAHNNFSNAIKIDPHSIPAYVNKADLYRAEGLDSKAEDVLKRALTFDNESSSIHLALGMLYVRNKQTGEALEHFKDALKYGPDNFQALYMYALALHSYGDSIRALKILEATYNKFKEWPAFNQLLITLCKQLGLSSKAQDYFAKFSKMNDTANN